MIKKWIKLNPDSWSTMSDHRTGKNFYRTALAKYKTANLFKDKSGYRIQFGESALDFKKRLKAKDITLIKAFFLAELGDFKVEELIFDKMNTKEFENDFKKYLKGNKIKFWNWQTHCPY